jgi:hypothetical protein
MSVWDQCPTVQVLSTSTVERLFFAKELKWECPDPLIHVTRSLVLLFRSDATTEFLRSCYRALLSATSCIFDISGHLFSITALGLELMSRMQEPRLLLHTPESYRLYTDCLIFLGSLLKPDRTRKRILPDWSPSMSYSSPTLENSTSNVVYWRGLLGWTER